MFYLEKYNLKDKVVVINGGTRGIGYACAEAFAECGATIVLADILPEVEASAKKLKDDKKIRVDSKVIDLTYSEKIKTFSDSVLESHQQVDILVNSQGIGGSLINAEEMADESWNKTIDINLNSVFWSCRAFGKIMLNQGSGSIINIGSMSGMIVNNGWSQSEYNASKAGVHMLTKSLAVEWAKRGVRVNAVAPGYIETDMTRPAYEKPELFKVMTEMAPQNRLGETHEIASTVLFLGSEASSFMTGSILVVDGGFTSW